MNIKQYTNFDVANFNTATKTVRVGGDLGEDREVQYKIITFSPGIIKFGYCCEPKALQYPIFIQTTDQSLKEFQIGKTGMFEIQPEEWINVNDLEPKEEEMLVSILQILVPWKWINEPVDENFKGYNFKLDYATGLFQ